MNEPTRNNAPDARVLELLRESGAMLEGHFVLSSGRHSDKYFQCAKLLQHPAWTAEALAPLAERIKAGAELAPDAVVGPAMGGIIAAWELGRQLGLRAFFTERNEEGTMSLRRGFEVRKGERIIIVEDVITTGKSYGECAAALETCGAVIAGVACIVDRRAPEAGVETRWPLYAACTVEAKNWDAESCALCRAGIPVVKPGSRKII